MNVCMNTNVTTAQNFKGQTSKDVKTKAPEKKPVDKKKVAIGVAAGVGITAATAAIIYGVKTGKINVVKDKITSLLKKNPVTGITTEKITTQKPVSEKIDVLEKMYKKSSRLRDKASKIDTSKLSKEELKTLEKLQGRYSQVQLDILDELLGPVTQDLRIKSYTSRLPDGRGAQAAKYYLDSHKPCIKVHNAIKTYLEAVRTGDTKKAQQVRKGVSCWLEKIGLTDEWFVKKAQTQLDIENKALGAAFKVV